MQKYSKVLQGLVVLIVVVGIGTYIGWRASRTPEATLPAPPVTAPIADKPTPPENPTPAPSSDPVIPEPATNTEIAAVTATNPPDIVNTNWEDQLDGILGSDSDDTNKVQQLFAMFPNLPPDGKEEIAQHLSNLVGDDGYAPLGKLLADPKQPEGVQDVLMADLLNRPNSTKLPMFLQLAQTPDHSKAEEAKELLELYVGDDYGSDWNTWQQKMQAWLQENPD